MGLQREMSAQTRFAWALFAVQAVFAAVFVVMVRYEDAADAAAKPTEARKHKIEETLTKYPMVLDIHMMIFAGFGFLMTFLKRYGFSSVSFTLLIATVVTEWALIIGGLLHAKDFTIKIGFMGILEGGLCAAAVLISFGAVLGKMTPLQLLVMALLETPVFVLNSYVGYTLCGVLDIGGAIYIHIFGAYFGLAVSAMHRNREVEHSSEKEGSRYTSDLFAMIGTIVLWVFWPSFNAILADGDAMHRAVLNTYLSLIGSTLATFLTSALLDDKKKFDMVDVQNATLSGGVAVGAIADLMIQPYGAFLAGSVTGIISTVGFRKLQGKILGYISLHDTCGVKNLHGIPGIISGILSVVFCAIASESTYGANLFKIFPKAAPAEGEDALETYRRELDWDDLPAGEGRTFKRQAIVQLMAVFVTLIIAIVTGIVTGLILKLDAIFLPLGDHQLFDDSQTWALPDEHDEKNDGEESESNFDNVNGKEIGNLEVEAP